ncbi:hypothetical protein Leryth_027180 [Lithospermum erythrorhizon]|nr:hypothetical protein Leryth_027180 [Lithospermum erythrorhizon]
MEDESNIEHIKYLLPITEGKFLLELLFQTAQVLQEHCERGQHSSPENKSPPFPFLHLIFVIVDHIIILAKKDDAILDFTSIDS